MNPTTLYTSVFRTMLYIFIIQYENLFSQILIEFHLDKKYILYEKNK